MSIQNLLIFGLAFWCSLINVCRGSEVVAWGSNNEGKVQFAAYSLPVGDGNSKLELVKICPASNLGGLILGPDQVVRSVGDVPTFLKPPEGLGKVVDIAAGRELGMALREDGTVAFWGVNPLVKSLVPQILTNVAAIAAGGNSYIVVDKTGALEIVSADKLTETLPEGIGNVAAVSLARGVFAQRRLALKQDGTVVEWQRHVKKAIPRTELSNVVAVAASAVHALALKRDGIVAAWGSNANGEKEVPEGLTNVVAIAAGGSDPGAGAGVGFSLALKADGTVVGWGKLWGHDSVVPPGLSNVVAIAAGENFCLAITTNATVAARFRR